MFEGFQEEGGQKSPLSARKMKESSSLQNLLVGPDGEAGADIPVLSNET